MSRNFSHDGTDDLICPYCDQAQDNNDWENLFYDQISEEDECRCSCDQEEFESICIKCDNEDCGRMFNTVYSREYEWWDSKAIDCKKQAHVWQESPESWEYEGETNYYYNCTKCSHRLYIKLNEDGSIPTPKEWSKLEKERKRIENLKYNKEERPLPDNKVITIRCRGKDSIDFCVNSDIPDGNKELWLELLKEMKKIGFKLGQEKDYQKGSRYVLLAKSKRYGNWKGLEFSSSIHSRGFEFEFYQNIVMGERKIGDGKYERHIFKLMPYLIKKKMEYTFLKLEEYLNNRENIKVIYELPGYMRETKDGGIGRDWHQYPETRGINNTKDKIKHIKEYCISKINPTHLESNHYYDSIDADGIKVPEGEYRYAYINNRLCKGQIYYRSGTYKYFIMNDNNYELVEVRHTFSKREDMSRRYIKLDERRRKLERVLKKLIDERNFIQCNKIQKEIDKLELKDK